VEKAVDVRICGVVHELANGGLRQDLILNRH
jgi:hypothetical protein